MSTIADWERDRFEVEASVEIASLPITDISHVEPIAVPDDIPTLVELKTRVSSGLGVQLLAEPVDNARVFVTLTLNGKTDTFEVPRDRALDAFDHPYCYGATLPIR